MFIMLLIGLVGCGASKKTTKTDTEETKTVFKTDTIYKLKTDSITLTKVETKVETKTEIQFDTIQKDCPKNKITYKASGDIEVEGNITAFNNLRNESAKKIDSIANLYEVERGNSLYWENEAKKVKTVEVVTRSNKWWLWLLIGFVLATVISPVELVKRFLKLK